MSHLTPPPLPSGRRSAGFTCLSCFDEGVDDDNRWCSCDWRNDPANVRRARRRARLRIAARKAAQEVPS